MHNLQPNPHATADLFKPAFIERYKELLADRYETFITYSTSYLRKAIRVNTLKTTAHHIEKQLQANWNLTPVPWMLNAYWIVHNAEDPEHRRLDIGNILEHNLGYFYVQEPASMLPPHILQPQPSDTVLDMCASPGSKTSQLAMYMKNNGCIIANEPERSRLAPLKANLQRCGVANTIITQHDGRHLKGTFDKILVDAPCSGTGTIRKSLKTLSMWNPKLITRLSRIQFSLIRHAITLLKPGGILVYSTCTMEPEENEAVVNAILAQHNNIDLLPIDIALQRSPAILQYNNATFDKRITKCLRIWPMDNDTEGFFVAKFQKH